MDYGSTAAILLTDGFEEGEAIIVIDMLRRYDIKVEIVSCQENIILHSYHDIQIKADALLADRYNADYAALIMVGGPQGTDNLGASETAINFIKEHIKNNRLICAMCSAGAKVLAKNGLLGEHSYVATGDLYKNFTDGIYVNQLIVEDGNFITGKDFGVAFDFAIAIAKRFIGERDSDGRGMSDVNWQVHHINYSQRN